MSTRTYYDWLEKDEQFSQATMRARGQARAALIKKIKLSDDWRAHAWLLSHCWPDEFSESRIMQPAPTAKPISITSTRPGALDEFLAKQAEVAARIRDLPEGFGIDTTTGEVVNVGQPPAVAGNGTTPRLNPFNGKLEWELDVDDENASDTE